MIGRCAEQTHEVRQAASSMDPHDVHSHDFYIKMPKIHSPYIFYTAAALLVAYVLYMIIRRRKGERPGSEDREPTL